MNLITRYLLSLLLAGFASGLMAAEPVTTPRVESLDHFPQTALTILTPDARQHQFRVWVADNQPRRQQGLMFVKGLPEQTGMLFVFDQPQRLQMWMKNTLIPLDMLFIAANGRVDSIAVNTTPLSLRIVDSNNPVLGVLELAGGSTGKLGIHAGDIVQHPAFGSAGGSR